MTMMLLMMMMTVNTMIIMVMMAVFLSDCVSPYFLSHQPQRQKSSLFYRFLSQVVASECRFSAKKKHKKYKQIFLRHDKTQTKFAMKICHIATMVLTTTHNSYKIFLLPFHQSLYEVSIL